MPDPITSLIEKLEGAAGPSIALDAEICWTLERDRATSAFWRGAMGRPGPLPDEFSRLPHGLGMASLEAGSPNYTASLDVALALAERVLPGWYWRAGRTPLGQWHHGRYTYGWAHLSRTDASNCDRGDESTGWAATPALALCAAILRAKQ